MFVGMDAVFRNSSGKRWNALGTTWSQFQKIPNAGIVFKIGLPLGAEFPRAVTPDWISIICGYLRKF
ncbi:hypothetical protein EGT49_07125 [Companilactobacillus suantsaicola]|uniref:Uncharacterized protein n=1 Tax=Companilactobacillus suantsaicola TaxID=2487723 RepID=A0A4Z0JLW1_9LACO|nr:hypothetical protein EGT49_07125 [Companilactobacillus suantsaicola]